MRLLPHIVYNVGKPILELTSSMVDESEERPNPSRDEMEANTAEGRQRRTKNRLFVCVAFIPIVNPMVRPKPYRSV